MSDEIEFERGRGNVFTDLGLPDSEEMLLKAHLVHQISLILEERGHTQAEAAELLGIDQPKVSRLLRGQLRGFSVERLTRFLNLLGQDVEIVVRPKPGTQRQGRTRVTARRRSGSRTLNTSRRPST
jgi:predicted XRE-type DNA-binding protein